MKHTHKTPKRDYIDERKMLIMKDPRGHLAELDHRGWWSVNEPD